MFFRFRKRTDGSVTVISAIALPVVIGFVSLVVEFGHGLLVKTEGQRVADLAAYAAAVAYGTTSSTATMVATAQHIAALNGIAASAVTATLGPSPRTPVNQAVQVVIRTSPVMLLAPVLRSGANLTISASSFAELGAATPACVLALSSSGTGITLSGGSTALAGPACTVSSNASIAVPCGTTISAKAVTYNGTVPNQPCQGITGSPLKTMTSDPLAANSGIAAIASHNAVVASLTGPAAPVVQVGIDIQFDVLTANTVVQALLAGCFATPPIFGGAWVLSCPAGGTYHFGNITVLPGVSVNFNPGATASTAYTVSGTIINNGNALNFGPGTYTIAKGVFTGSGSTTFAPGTYSIGPAATACNGAGKYSLCNKGNTTTFTGPSSISLSAGFYNATGSILTLGTGTGNTLAIGPASDGNAMYVGGGATTALGGTDVNPFQLVGNVTAGGAACTTFGIASQHDIRGNVATAAGLTLSSGVYTATGTIAIGAGGGGDVTCSGSPIGITASGVTLVTMGGSTLLGSACNGTVFCLGSGFGNVTLSAPTAGLFSGLAVVGPLSSANPGSIMLSEGATTTLLSGALYAPQGSLTMTGAATIGTGASSCLTMIANQVSLSGGTRATAASCFVSAAAAPALVQ